MSKRQLRVVGLFFNAPVAAFLFSLNAYLNKYCNSLYSASPLRRFKN